MVKKRTYINIFFNLQLFGEVFSQITYLLDFLTYIFQKITYKIIFPTNNASPLYEKTAGNIPDGPFLSISVRGPASSPDGFFTLNSSFFTLIPHRRRGRRVCENKAGGNDFRFLPLP